MQVKQVRAAHRPALLGLEYRGLVSAALTKTHRGLVCASKASTSSSWTCFTSTKVRFSKCCTN